MLRARQHAVAVLATSDEAEQLRVARRLRDVLALTGERLLPASDAPPAPGRRARPFHTLDRVFPGA